MRLSRSGSAPSSSEFFRALESKVPALVGDTAYSMAQGYEYDDAPVAEEVQQPWIVSSLSGLSIVEAPAGDDKGGLQLALWRPWTDVVSARSLSQQGVIEITWIDGTTSALEITDKSRRRRRGLALSIKEQIQGSVIVSERHIIAGQEVLVAVRRSALEGVFSQVIGTDPSVLQNPEIAEQVNAIESKLRSMCGLTP